MSGELKMIYFRHEGDTVSNGINFYPLTSVSSFGFRIRMGDKLFRVRYSKVAKKWFIGRSAI
jgi:hypothetical protein